MCVRCTYSGSSSTPQFYVRATEAGKAGWAGAQDSCHLLLLEFQSSVAEQGKVRNILALSLLPYFPGTLSLSSLTFPVWTTLSHSRLHQVIMV